MKIIEKYIKLGVIKNLKLQISMRIDLKKTKFFTVSH
jgi:hypothetical protein